MKAFDFGQNWKEYSQHYLNEEAFESAKSSLRDLVEVSRIENKNFIDIGCGSGIFALAAKKLGAAKVVGIDISQNSVDAANLNKKRFCPNDEINYYKFSILDEDYNKVGKFDVVYSWGVLHHTGDMWEAIKKASSLVSLDGYFVIAIYNKHWTSLSWKLIKFIYNVSPIMVKKLIVLFFYYFKILFFKIFNKSLLKKRRGMDFYYDVIDWIGGYPYEYASKKEIVDFLSKEKFKLIKFVRTGGWTGCNEYVFVKKEK